MPIHRLSSSAGLHRRPYLYGLVLFVFTSAATAQQPPSITQLPTGGRVIAGQVGIQQNGATLNVIQSTARGVVDWSTFNVGSQAQVNFIQPSASAVTLNRVLDSNPSQIFGRITATGQVFLTNPSGIYFSPTSTVDVGGLVATTLGMSASDFMAGGTRFKSSDGIGLVLNQGRLTAADGGYIALLAPQVKNEGVVIARLGTVALASGNAVTLQLNDRSLVKVEVDEGAINGLIENKSLVKADGGLVLMSAKAANNLAESVIQNTGTVQAQTVEKKAGRIFLLGDMTSGKLNVDGVLDASAPTQGDGGFVETSAARVKVSNSALVTTKAEKGKTGKWLVDPQDYTVAASGGDQTGSQLSTAMATTNVELQSAAGGTTGSGDVNINDAVTWSSNNTLTLTASNNVNVNANILATGASAGLVINPNSSNQFGMNPTESASGSGVFNIKSGVSIGLPNVSASSQTALVISGTPYTVINSLGVAGSTTGLDLQGVNGNLSGYYALGSNIDASLTSAWNGGIGFAPIGGNPITNYTPRPAGFSGVLNGLGNSVSNLSQNYSGNYNFVGLFSVLSSTSTVRNISITQANLVGGGHMGVLAGVNGGLIDNVTSSGNVNSTSASGASVGDNVGGLVGVNDGTVTNSSSSANVQIKFDGGGGLVGHNAGTISNSTSSGTITKSANSYGSVGGLVGFNNAGLIDSSSSSATVVAGDGSHDIGGLVGTNLSSASINSSSSTGTLTIGNSIVSAGGLVGNSSSPITNSFSSASLTVGSNSKAVGGLVGTNSAAITNSYANGQMSLGINAASAGGFIGIDSGTISNSYASTSMTLGAGSGGTFYTNSGGGVGGFIGYSHDDTIDRSHSMGTITVNGNAFQLGGFIGQSNSTTITKSYAAVPVSITGTAGYVGGFVGNTNSTHITNAYATGNIHAAAGSSHVGGFIGNAFSSGTVVTNAYSSGLVGATGSTNIAGFSGGVEQGPTISNSYWNTETSGQSVGVKDAFSNTPVTSLGVTGMTSSQMSNLSNFTTAGWSSQIWSSAPTVNNGFPILANGFLFIRASSGTSIYGATPAIGFTLYDAYSGGNAVSGIQTNGTALWSIAKNGVLSSLTSMSSKVDVASYDISYASGLTSLNGSYLLVPGASGNWQVTPAPLIVTATAVTKVYDATAAASGAGVVTGLISGDVVNSAGTQVYADKNVGNTNKVVKAAGVTLKDGSGTDMTGNYSITYIDTSLGTITPTALTVTAQSDTKIYDTTTSSSLLPTVSGLQGSDTVTDKVQAFDVKSAGSRTLSVTGYTLNDGNSGNNYTVTTQSARGTITPADLQVTGISAPNKVYDTTTTATLTGTATVSALSSDVVSATGTGAGQFADKNVGTGKAVTVTGYTLTGTDAGNYNVLQPTGVTADITKADLQVTGVSAQNKVYDATTTATLTGAATVSGLTGDAVSAGGTGAGQFADKNVGIGKGVMVTGYTLTGTDAGNYNVLQPTGVTADITKADLQVTGVSAQNKVYDATTSATLTGAATVTGLSGDAVSATGMGAGQFANKNVGTGKAVTVTGYTLTGSDAGNYNVLQPIGLTADISKADLQVTGVSAQNKVYDTTITATLTGAAAVTGLGSDTVSATGTGAGQFADKNVGIGKGVTVTGYTLTGIDAGNYNVLQPTGVTADITKADLQVAAVSAQNKVYDATTNATLTGTATVTGLSGDTVSATGTGAGQFANKNVGAGKAVTVTGYTLTGSDAGNYNVLQPTGLTADITKADLQVTGVSAQNKVYDTTTTATLSGTAAVSGLTGDTVSATGTGSGSFADKVAGTGKAVTVTGYTLTGTDAGNYNVLQPTGLTADITKADLQVTGVSAQNKVYDATTSATLTGAATVTGLSGDAVSANGMGAGQFANKNVGTGKAVTVTGYTLTGSDAGNYNVLQPIGLTADISKADLQVISVIAQNKVYDTTTTATLTGTAGVMPLGADVVSVSGAGAGQFPDKNVGTSKAVTVTGYSLTGGDAGNYNVLQPTGLTANITKADLQVTGIGAQNKVYDTTTTATLTGTAAVSPLGTDSVNVTGIGAGKFVDKSVEVNKSVTVTGFVLTGVDANNYRLLQPIGVTASIVATDERLGMPSSQLTSPISNLGKLSFAATSGQGVAVDISVSKPAESLMVNLNLLEMLRSNFIDSDDVKVSSLDGNSLPSGLTFDQRTKQMVISPSAQNKSINLVFSDGDHSIRANIYFK